MEETLTLAHPPTDKLRGMPLFCDVALPVPLDNSFTYAVGKHLPVVGARVLVPFRGRRLMGIVTRLHDDVVTDRIEIKSVQTVLDEEALVSEELMRLAEWIAHYYIAPFGEVLRGMLPLGAEVKHQLIYQIAEPGRKMLYEGAEKGSSRRSRLTGEEQSVEYAVLNYLEDGHAAKASKLGKATGVRKILLDGMVRKRWLTRVMVAEQRDARQFEDVAMLLQDERLPKLNQNQTAILAELAAAGERIPLRRLRGTLCSAGVPESTVGTLVRRGLIALRREEREFCIVGVGADCDGGPPRGDEDPEGEVRQRKKSAHEHVLNEAQMGALGAILASMDKGRFEPHLLYGVTGSGKTAVYVAAMQRTLEGGKGALLLVPEIGLTPSMAGQMYAAFGGEVALLHSQLRPDERAHQWHKIRRGEARVVVGTRSAVFAPLHKLGLVIVDEEHDASYKQEESPRYHGRDVAVMRAKLSEAVVVLGSATPSLESWSNAERGRYRRIEMLTRVAGRPLPVVEVVDMRDEFRTVGRDEIFSRQLLQETQSTLDRGEQVMILLNRRGYSFVVMCRSCGEKIECENCAISLTFHKPVSKTDLQAQPGRRLECHYCGFRREVPLRCPKCESDHLYYLGAGSQQGEERLRELFPNAQIGRMDRDTVRGRGTMERLLARLHAGEINLLIGTQMIAKGHDVHGVTLVGVVGADFALGLPDFRAAERVFQLLTQVSGRAGRGELPGRVLVQSYHPDHYAMRFAQHHDYPGFAARELQYRGWMHYPPHSVLANIIVQSEQMEEAAGWAAKLGKWLQRQQISGLRVLGPAAAPITRLKRIYRFHFVLKTESRQVLRDTLRAVRSFAEESHVPRKSVIIDVDAVHLM